MHSGITSGRVLNGELLYTKILEVNLFAFAYRLFRRDFSPCTRRDILHGYSFLFAALYTFSVNLGGFYEWAVLISPAPIFSLDFLIIGKSVHPKDTKRQKHKLLTKVENHRQRKGLSALREKLWPL